MCSSMQHSQIAGKPLQPLLPLYNGNIYRGTRLIAVPNGKNAKDWVIRSQAPKVQCTMEKVQRLNGCGF